MCVDVVCTSLYVAVCTSLCVSVCTSKWISVYDKCIMKARYVFIY